MKNFYYSIVPVPVDAIGTIIEECDEQGYAYVDAFPIGAAPANTIISGGKQQFIPLFMLLVCKEFPDKESSCPPEATWQKHNPPSPGMQALGAK